MTPTGPRDDPRWPILRAKAEVHWREYCPSMYGNLKAAGNLDGRLDSAVEATIRILNQCEESGLNPDQARELAYANILLPEEEGDDDDEDEEENSE